MTFRRIAFETNAGEIIAETAKAASLSPYRTKNILQMIHALASRASKTTDPVLFYEALSGRLKALDRANELLRFGTLHSCELRTLVEAAITPFNISQIEVHGPDTAISERACTPLMLALHELCTNATK